MLARDRDAAHDLHRIVDDLEGCVRAVVLACRGRAGVVVPRVPVGVPGRLVQHVLHGVELDLHGAELQRVELEAGDRLAERDTLPGVLRGIFERADRRTVIAGADKPAFEIEVGDAAVEAVAFRAEEVLLLHLHVVEIDLAAGIHAKAELGQRGQLDAGLGHIDEEFADDIGVIGIAAHDDQILDALGRRDERLGAVEVDLPIAARVGRGQAADIGTRAGLGAGGVEDLLA